MRDRLLLLTLSSLLALGALSCGAPHRAPPAIPSTEVARIANGRVALVALWATWCDACKKELDALARLDARTRKRGDAVVVGIAIGDTKDDVATFARAHGLPFEQVVDEDYAIADALGERRVPTTLVLDRRGRIVYRGTALDGEALAAFRRELDQR